jgi:hypothetical protein
MEKGCFTREHYLSSVEFFQSNMLLFIKYVANRSAARKTGPPLAQRIELGGPDAGSATP